MSQPDTIPAGAPSTFFSFPRTTEVIDYIVSVNPHLIRWIQKKEREGFNTRAYFDVKADNGTRLHTLLEGALLAKSTKDVPEADRDRIQAVVDWVYKERGAKSVWCEVPLWMAGRYRLRGTTDCVYVTGDGKRVLADYKSGRMSRTHWLQLNMYAMMWEVRHPDQPIDEIELWYSGEKKLTIENVPIIKGLGKAVLMLYNALRRYENVH